ncbi:MAG TPA: tripartite tricarboxylate transporter substrate binding protein [Burkholderiaceae bacterium]|nr:tripartite tricarboxylate transporter substrate binding protein [Burkholderiaceae bacterium]
MNARMCLSSAVAAPKRLASRRALVLSGLIAASAVFGLAPSAAYSETFPSKPIMLVIPFPGGGVMDPVLRPLAAAAAKELGQPIVLMHKPGAGGVIGTASLTINTPADGHTIALMHNSVIRQPLLQKVNWDPLKDFTYVIGLGEFTTGILVRNDAPWKNLNDLLADAKARPGAISYGNVGATSANRIAGEKLARMAGTSFNMVPFKGGAEASTALLGGHLDVYGDPGVGRIAQGGQARMLATFTEARLKRWPDVPTVKEAGYDLTIRSPFGLVAPKGMDPKIVARLHDAFRKATEDPAYVRALEDFDLVSALMTGEEYTRYAATQFELEKIALEKLGFKPE